MSQSVLQRIAAGDPSAVDECIDRYRSLIWSLARRSIKNHADLEDAVQEILIEIWRNAERFDPALASEATFITMIARRRLIDRQRRQARLPAWESLVEELTGGPGHEARAVESGEESQKALHAMQFLRPEERLVLEMALLEGRTQQQIATSTNMPLGTVKTHSRRGLKRLRELLNVDVDTAIPAQLERNSPHR